MRKKHSPLVSIVTLSYNRRKYILELINSLVHQDYPNFEVIMVDNDSRDGTADAVEVGYPNVRVIRCHQNYGMVAYNYGFENSRGKYVLVIDDDGLPASPDWISQIVDCFESNPRLGAAACTIRMQETGRIAPDSPQFIPGVDTSGGLPTAAYNGTGAGLRSSALHQVGYYPFLFFRSWLELHLCTRLLEAGWDVRYFPSIEIWHRRPSGMVDRPLTYYGLRNYLWYVWTFYPCRQMLVETMRFIGSRLKYVIKRQIPVLLFTKALFDSVVAWPEVASDRRPISFKTLQYLQHIRQYVNNHRT